MAISFLSGEGNEGKLLSDTALSLRRKNKLTSTF